MEEEGHIIDFKGLFAGARRTSVTGSVIESYAVRHLLHFLPQEQFAKVEARLSSKDVSILAKYSWAIPITPMSCLPKDEVFNALKSPILRHDYYSRMVVGDDFHSVEEVIDRLLNHLADLGVEGAKDGVEGAKDLALEDMTLSS